MEKKRKTVWSKIKKIPRFIKVPLLLIVAALLVFSGITLSNSLKNKETILESGFKNVGYLVTQEWRGTILEDASKDRSIFDLIHIPFTKSYLIFSLDVEVLAGINFDEIKPKFEKNVNGEEVIKVYLPHSTVEKSYEVTGTYQTHIDEESWFSNISAEEQQKLKDAMVKKGEEKAKNSGLLDRADSNAQKIIESMLSQNEVTKNYKVEFVYK